MTAVRYERDAPSTERLTLCLLLGKRVRGAATLTGRRKTGKVRLTCLRDVAFERALRGEMWYNSSISVNENRGVDAPLPLTMTVLEVLTMADIDITTQNATEEWRDIPGYEGVYQVSSFGRVKRFYRKSERVLACSTGSDYLRLKLSMNNRQHQRTVHSLVAEVFLGERPNGWHVNHIDGNKLNNALTNLEYVTVAENARHAYRLGLRLVGEACAQSKLTAFQVCQIRALHTLGFTNPLIARIFGVDTSTIHYVLIGRNWSHLHCDDVEVNLDELSEFSALCACGCGERFFPHRGMQQKYLNREHQRRRRMLGKDGGDEC